MIIFMIIMYTTMVTMATTQAIVEVSKSTKKPV
jgi:hypothetical protein